MEDQPVQNTIPDPNPTPVQIPEPKAKFPVMYLVLSVFILLFLASTAFLYYQNMQLKNMLVNYQAPAASPTPTPDPTANWKTYTNNKFGYSIQYPHNYVAGYPNVYTASFDKAVGDESQIDFLPSTNDEFNNFLRIQIYVPTDYHMTSNDLINKTYLAQKSNKATISISDLIKSKISGYGDFEYTFTGEVLNFLPEEGSVVTSGKYKVIFFEKNNNLYAIYLRDSETFDQILSTFHFLK